MVSREIGNMTISKRSDIGLVVIKQNTTHIELKNKGFTFLMCIGNCRSVYETILCKHLKALLNSFSKNIQKKIFKFFPRTLSNCYKTIFDFYTKFEQMKRFKVSSPNYIT